MVDAASHQPVNASQFVYAELVSPIDSVIARVKIHPDANGVFWGYLFKGHAFDNRPIEGIGNDGTLFRTTHQVTKR